MKLLALLSLLFISQSAFAQAKMRSVEELIDPTEEGWNFVKDILDSAINTFEILPADNVKAHDALLHSQVSTRSPMGAVIYKTGGILVDHGWIRILGSGSPKLTRSLPEWNKGRTFKEYGDMPVFLLIADDAAGGFFAIDGGAFKGKPGLVWYFSPDDLKWEPLEITYSQFLFFCFRTDLNAFYSDMRWKAWKDDVEKLGGDKCYNFYPPLSTAEGKDIEKDVKKAVPISEQFALDMEMVKKMKEGK